MCTGDFEKKYWTYDVQPVAFPVLRQAERNLGRLRLCHGVTASPKGWDRVDNSDWPLDCNLDSDILAVAAPDTNCSAARSVR